MTRGIEIEELTDEWVADRVDWLEREYPELRKAMDDASCSCCWRYETNLSPDASGHAFEYETLRWIADRNKN